MPIVSHEGVSFSGLAQAINLLESKYTETSIWSVSYDNKGLNLPHKSNNITIQ